MEKCAMAEDSKACLYCEKYAILEKNPIFVSPRSEVCRLTGQ
jgi:hypothetical protein